MAASSRNGTGNVFPHENISLSLTKYKNQIQMNHGAYERLKTEIVRKKTLQQIEQAEASLFLNRTQNSCPSGNTH